MSQEQDHLDELKHQFEEWDEDEREARREELEAAYAAFANRDTSVENVSNEAVPGETFIDAEIAVTSEETPPVEEG